MCYTQVVKELEALGCTVIAPQAGDAFEPVYDQAVAILLMEAADQGKIIETQTVGVSRGTVIY